MKKLLLVLASALLIFGCISLPGGTSLPKNLSVPTVPNVTQAANQSVTAPVVQTCSPSYSFTDPSPAVLGGTGALSVSATCAANKAISVEVAGVSAGQSTVPGDSAVLNFNLPASADGTVKVEVKSDGASIHSADWEVKPIGYSNTAGIDNDQVSIKNWKAVAFDVQNPISVKKAGAYLRRLQSMTLQGSTVIVEIRSDSGGAPGAVVSSGSLPITGVTMTPNWIYFPMNAQLQKGRYWLVFKVDQAGSAIVSDVVNIQYYSADKTKPGNQDHMKMDLQRNEDTQQWEETTWDTLAYDRNYAFSVSSSG